MFLLLMLSSTGIHHFPTPVMPMVCLSTFPLCPHLGAGVGLLEGRDAGCSEDQNFSFKEPYVLEVITGSPSCLDVRLVCCPVAEPHSTCRR